MRSKLEILQLTTDQVRGIDPSFLDLSESHLLFYEGLDFDEEKIIPNFTQFPFKDFMVAHKVPLRKLLNTPKAIPQGELDQFVRIFKRGNQVFVSLFQWFDEVQSYCFMCTISFHERSGAAHQIKTLATSRHILRYLSEHRITYSDYPFNAWLFARVVNVAFISHRPILNEREDHEKRVVKPPVAKVKSEEDGLVKDKQAVEEDVTAQPIYHIIDKTKATNVYPTKVKRGGTHASPKEHPRVGHFRRNRNGELVFIEATIVNKGKGRGKIVCDYKFPGNLKESEDV